MISQATGQLPSSAAAIFTAAGSAVGQATVTLQNTSGSTTETITLTLTRAADGASPTARRIAHLVLAPNEQAILQGVPVALGDVIKGVTTDATTVDYTVSTAATDLPLRINAFDANGSLKQTQTTSGGQTIPGLLTAQGGLQFKCNALSGSADAIPATSAGVYVITATGVDAMTLGAPTATTDDGYIVIVTSNTAHAHTITATGLFQTGGTTVNEATFAAHPGASITLMAYQGLWNVIALNGVTMS